MVFVFLVPERGLRGVLRREVRIRQRYSSARFVGFRGASKYLSNVSGCF